MTQTMPNQMTDQMRACIQNCQECHALCVETAQHCLTMGGKHASADHIRTLLDCAQSCATSLDFMLRMSPHHPKFCGSCAEVCKACGDSCEQLAGGDDLMRRCAESCRRCEGSCRQMAGHVR